MIYSIDDWDDAYANTPHIPRAEAYPDRWAREAADFRATANLRDGLFWPQGTPRGLAVFIHGGYWMKFDPDFWSHLAAGALARGWAVQIPGYPLAPEARISRITAEVGAAIADAASRVAGPIVLSGHSAGGHLASRMVCRGGPLPEAVAARVVHCLPISGLFDLRPLLNTAMNATLQLDLAEAVAESPALMIPRAGTRISAWVGGGERGEFLRQSALIANIWAGLGARTENIVEPDRHHFSILDGLADPDHPLIRHWLQA